MSVRRTANGRWQARVKSGRIDVSAKTFDLKREALAWEASEKRRVTAGFDPRLGRSTVVADAVGEWLESREGSVAESTYKRDESILQRLPKNIASKPIGAVTHAEVNRYILRYPGTGGTKTRVKISCSSFFAWAVRRGYIDRNPVEGVKVASGELHGFRAITWDETEALAGQLVRADHEDAARIVRMLAYSGLRWGELRALRVLDVKRIGGDYRLWVGRSWSEGRKPKDVKQHAERFVPVLEPIRNDLETLLKGKGRLDPVATLKSGRSPHKSNFRRDYWDAVSGGLRLHDLRHTAISEWTRLGVPPSTAKVWAGHSSLAITNRYVHANGLADKAAVQMLNDKTSGGHRGDTEGPDSADPSSEYQ
jgi:integrase